MTAVFAILIAGSFFAAVAPEVTPLKPERLAELMKKLEKPQFERVNYKTKKPEKCFLDNTESNELCKGGKDAVETLLQFAANKTKLPEARALAVDILCQCLAGYFIAPDERIVKALIAAAGDPERKVREAVGSRIATMGLYVNEEWEKYKPNYLKAIHPDALSKLTPSLVKMVADEDGEARINAMYALATNKLVGTGINEMLVAAESKDADVRATALGGLANLGRSNPKVLPLILKELSKKDLTIDVQATGSAVYAIGRFGSLAKDAVPDLIRVVESKHLVNDEGNASDHASNLYRMGAIKSLGEIGPDAKKAIPAILVYYKSAECINYNNFHFIRLAVMKIDAETGEKLMGEFRKEQAEFLRKYKER